MTSGQSVYKDHDDSGGGNNENILSKRYVAFDFEWRSGYLIMTPKRRVLILP